MSVEKGAECALFHLRLCCTPSKCTETPVCMDCHFKKCTLAYGGFLCNFHRGSEM